MASKTIKFCENHAEDDSFSRPRKNGFCQQPLKKRFINGDRKPKLPVCKYRETFLKLLNENQALVIAGETGSGKTTQIPQWCNDYCSKTVEQLNVACSQPRRIAAMSVAARVAKEMNVTLGREVGYSVRFDSCCTANTSLKYLTDGMLLREAMLDGLLSSYGVIILDETHERTLQTEILIGVVKRALIARNSVSKLPQLKVIVMSATINVKLFKKYFHAPILTIEGRQHQVQDMFAEVAPSDLFTATLETVFKIHRTQNDGDILVFCSGQDEIQSLITLTKKVLKIAPKSLQNLIPLPLYASLPASNQMRVFELSQTIESNDTSDMPDISQFRRVIFSTNVAETSVTIPNIRYVIDTGKVKCRTYCPNTGFESLKITSISKAQATQRSGRAGRIGPGTCYRLYTDEEYKTMADHLLPEIKRCNMDSVLLQMISIGIKNISSFEFLEKPDEARVEAALSNLLALRAIKACNRVKKSEETNGNAPDCSPNSKSMYHRNTNDDNLLNLDYELTNIGKKLSAFPLSPSMSRVLLAANDLHCLDEALTIVSLFYIENLFHIPPNSQTKADMMLEKFRSNEGDAIMFLKVYKAFRRTSTINRSGLKLWCSEHFIHVKNLKLARLVRKQLLDLCKSLGMEQSSCGQNTSVVRRALTHGFFNNVATMWNGKYRNKSSNEIYIHPNSCLFKTKPESVLYVEIVETNKCYMRNCTLIDMSWLSEMSTSNSNITK